MDKFPTKILFVVIWSGLLSFAEIGEFQQNNPFGASLVCCIKTGSRRGSRRPDGDQTSQPNSDVLVRCVPAH